MIITEDEAKTKRCQESYAAADGLSTGGYVEPVVPFPPAATFSAAVSMGARQTAPAFCIGSACMAWRWYLERPRGGTDDCSHSMSYSVARGYCGKAGAP